MPSIATGANLANRELVYVVSRAMLIRLYRFAHAARRQLNMMYIVENNGTYDLTKGQLSATTDTGAFSKVGEVRLFSAIDLVGMAALLGASFVARSFFGDEEQLVSQIKAAITHRGFAFIDCISPCVTSDNYQGSTKSFDYAREHNVVLNRPDFVPQAEGITVSYELGETRDITLHNGDVIALHKIAYDYDPTDRAGALSYPPHRQAGGYWPNLYQSRGRRSSHHLRHGGVSPKYLG